MTSPSFLALHQGQWLCHAGRRAVEDLRIAQKVLSLNGNTNTVKSLCTVNHCGLESTLAAGISDRYTATSQDEWGAEGER